MRELMDSDEILRDVWVQGEISNLSRPASGHIYFTLKDASSALKCVVWKMTAARLPILLQSGMAVEAHGAVSVYERDGQYQLYVDSVRLSGEGALYQEFVRLKTRLEAEGLFDPERKQPLPETPQRIGIVTSATGAALQDVLNTLRRRYPIAEVWLSPAPVQGDEAPPALVKALAILDGSVDVILLVRGGGSLEDLWAFNDERVVRAVANLLTPVVTGIGHEIDFTLSDFAADLRAPTPTAAAELSTPDQAELRDAINALTNRMGYTLRSAVSAAAFDLAGIRHQLDTLSPVWLVRNDRQRLDELQNRADLAFHNDLRFRGGRVASLQGRLDSLNPLAVLQRGYAIVSDSAGRAVSSIAQVKLNQELDIRLADGKIRSTVGEIHGGLEHGEN